MKNVKIGERFKIYENSYNSNKKYPEPEWTAANMNRERGDTTFKQCGWCEYADGGLGRDSCYLESKCSLMSTYGIGSQTYWDTSCIFKHLSSTDLKGATQYHKNIINEFIKKIQDHKKYIAILKAQMKKTGNDKTPPLVSNRASEYFNIGDRIRLFLDGDIEGGITDGKVEYVKGTVVNGYRHHDGCVSYVLDDYPESQKGWGCGVCMPFIMLEKDYQFFKKHLDKFRIWLEFQDKDYNGKCLNLQLMYDIMVKDKRRKIKWKK